MVLIPFSICLQGLLNQQLKIGSDHYPWDGKIHTIFCTKRRMAFDVYVRKTEDCKKQDRKRWFWCLTLWWGSNGILKWIRLGGTTGYVLEGSISKLEGKDTPRKLRALKCSQSKALLILREVSSQGFERSLGPETSSCLIDTWSPWSSRKPDISRCILLSVLQSKLNKRLFWVSRKIIVISRVTIMSREVSNALNAYLGQWQKYSCFKRYS